MKRRLTIAMATGAAVLLTGAFGFGRLVFGGTGLCQAQIRSFTMAEAPGGGQPGLAKLSLKDPDTCILSVTGSLTSPDGLDAITVPFSPQKGRGQFTALLTLPNGAVPGEWTLGGLKAQADTGDTVALTGAVTVSVRGVLGSQLVESIEIPKGNFRETQILPVRIYPAPGISIRTAGVVLVGPKGQVIPQVTQVAQDVAGPIKVPVRLTKGAGSGAWHIKRIVLTDQNGAVHQLTSPGDFDGRITVVKGREDLTPPQIAHAALSEAAVQTGQAVRLQAEVTDDLAGVSAVTARLIDANGLELESYGLMQEEEGSWSAEVSVPPYGPPGTWRIEVDAVDGVSNRTGKPFTVPFEVTAGVASPAAAELTGIRLEFAAGMLMATAEVAGHLPVRSVTVTIAPPNEAGAYRILPLVPDTHGVWRGALPLSEYAAAGTWQVVAVSLEDATGRHLDRTAADLPESSGTVRVTTSAPDADAPVLDSLALTGAGRPGERIQITAEAHDDLSGVESIAVALQGPEQAVRSVALRLDETGTAWVGSFVIPADGQKGTWRVTKVILADAAGNVAGLKSGPGFDATVHTR
jgi:hypothetical protein